MKSLELPPRVEPLSEAAVEVPCVRVGEDESVPLAQELADPVVVPAAPHLDHVVILGQVPASKLINWIFTNLVVTIRTISGHTRG